MITSSEGRWRYMITRYSRTWSPPARGAEDTWSHDIVGHDHLQRGVLGDTWSHNTVGHDHLKRGALGDTWSHDIVGHDHLKRGALGDTWSHDVVGHDHLQRGVLGDTWSHDILGHDPLKRGAEMFWSPCFERHNIQSCWLRNFLFSQINFNLKMFTTFINQYLHWLVVYWRKTMMVNCYNPLGMSQNLRASQNFQTSL